MDYKQYLPGLIAGTSEIISIRGASIAGMGEHLIFSAYLHFNMFEY